MDGDGAAVALISTSARVILSDGYAYPPYGYGYAYPHYGYGYAYPRYGYGGYYPYWRGHARRHWRRWH